jgi:hypothetical protein
MVNRRNALPVSLTCLAFCGCSGSMPQQTSAAMASIPSSSGASGKSESATIATLGDRGGAILPVLPVVTSTVPANGDLNPYGVAFVPPGFAQGGTLSPGDLLVSNFNNSNNLQGTGTTIVKIGPDGKQSVFFQGQPGLGLSTALHVLRAGFVIVGNFPSTDGTCGNSSPGSILVIDASGNLLASVTPPGLNGPWDSTLDDDGDRATLFVSSALTGTVLRFDLNARGGMVSFSAPTVVASGYAFRCDPVTFVVAPTGLVYDERQDVLFVASTGDNAVFAIEHAATRASSGGTGKVIYQDGVHLHGPLAMVQGPNGHLFVSNNDGINGDPNQPSEIVEFTKGGKFLRQLSVDPAQGGAFGLGFDRALGDTVRFAAVDDNANNITVWTLSLESGER